MENLPRFWGKPSRILLTVLVTVLNGVRMPRTGATSPKDCPNNTIIMNLNDAKLHCSKNEGRKKTALICGVLSPVLNGFSRPPSMFRVALRIAAWFSCVNFSSGNVGNVAFKLFAPKNKKVIIENSPPIYEYPQRATLWFVDLVLQVVGICLI